MRNPYQPASPDWYGLYAGSTSRDDLLFESSSVSHPAKMSLPLLHRILETMQEWGWLQNGSCVIDPFGGRGSTAAVWCALHPDNRAVTIEIEPHFVAMQHANKAHAEARLGRELRWEILQGDSRKCDELLQGVGRACAVASPPYEQSLHGGRSDSDASNGIGRTDGKPRGKTAWGDYGSTEAAAVTSPPYGDALGHPSLGSVNNDEWGREGTDIVKRRGLTGQYGSSPGQIGEMPDAAVLSPPYGQGTIARVDVEKLRALTKDSTSSLYGRDPDGAWFQAMAAGYVNSPGNIDNLPDVASVTSPPYEQSVNDRNGIDAEKCEKAGKRSQARSKGYASAVTSPPYEGSLASGDPEKTGGLLFNDPRRRSDRTLTNGYQQPAAVLSPPYDGEVSQSRTDKHPDRMQGSRQMRQYGDVDASILSPPYEAQSGGNTPPHSDGPLSDPHMQKRHAASRIGADGSYSAVSSPPYEAQAGGTGIPEYEQGPRAAPALLDRHAASSTKLGYGGSDAQIGTTQGEDYATACLAVYSALARAGVRYVAIVTKNPTRAKKLRRLEKLTARLLRQSGYRVVAWRRAWLFESEAQTEQRMGQATMFGEEVSESGRVRGRLSFFARLHLAKGGIRAQYEDVLFAELAEAGNGS